MTKQVRVWYLTLKSVSTSNISVHTEYWKLDLTTQPCPVLIPWAVSAVHHTVPNCQDDHLSQQGFFITLRCSSDVNPDMSIWTMSNNHLIRFRCSSYEIDVHPCMEAWPFVKYSLHPVCQRCPSGPRNTFVKCHFQASFKAKCTSVRVKMLIWYG